jgi:hypothetical protein
MTNWNEDFPKLRQATDEPTGVQGATIAKKVFESGAALLRHAIDRTNA